jgi:peptidoglycan/LPS O-acetylase OafA/YrhL
MDDPIDAPRYNYRRSMGRALFQAGKARCPAHHRYRHIDSRGAKVTAPVAPTERTAHSDSERSHRPHLADIPALTGLRFVAAFSVMFAHGVSTLLADHETPLGAVYWLKQASGFGMTLFFVLSGFVIHYNYATLVTSGGFNGIAAYLWARFARLYPLFLLMLLVNVLVSSRHFDLWQGHPERLVSTLQALPYFLLSVHSWVYIPVGENALISAIGGGSPLTWSISTEWFFYFFYPVVALLVLRLRRPQITAVVVVFWCVAWFALASSLYDRSAQIDAWAVARFGAVADLQTNQQDSFVRWLFYFSPYLRMGEFILGAFIAQLHIQLRHRVVSKGENFIGALVMLAAVLGVCLITYWIYDPNVSVNLFRKTNMNFALAPTAAALIFFAARCDNVVSRLLASRPAVAMGEASYSIYLVHYVVLVIVVRLSAPAAHGPVFDVAKLVVVMSGILMVSLAMYAYFEAPSRRWLRQQWSNTRAVAALPAVVVGLALIFVGAARFF